MWKLILALEPDFHFKPPVELYNLIEDPQENDNLAQQLPEVVTFLTAQMEAWIAKREKETGLKNPITNQPGWHGAEGIDYFESSQQAYDTLHIGTPGAAQKLQAKGHRGAKQAMRIESRIGRDWAASAITTLTAILTMIWRILSPFATCDRSAWTQRWRNTECVATQA